MIEAYLQADAGKFKLTDKVALKDADKVPGSGILNYHLSEGATLSVRDPIRLMIALSDNTATNMVLDKVGIAAVNQRMAGWGLKETRINAKVFRGSTTSVDPARTRRYGLGSTTAREMVALLEEFMLGERVRPALKLAMLGHLRKNEDKDKFPRLLRADSTVAHKDGAVSDARTDAGLLYTPAGVIAVCVLTNGNADRRWDRDNAGNLLCAGWRGRCVITSTTSEDNDDDKTSEHRHDRLRLHGPGPFQRLPPRSTTSSTWPIARCSRPPAPRCGQGQGLRRPSGATSRSRPTGAS